MQSPCHEGGTSSKLLVGNRLRNSTAQTRLHFCFARGNFRFRIWDRFRSSNRRRTCPCLKLGYARTVEFCHQFMRGIREQESKQRKRRTLGNYEVHVAWEGFASI